MRRGTAYLAVLFMGAGFGLIWLGWNGAAEKDCVQCQVPYLISGGLGGLGLIVAGAALAMIHEVRRTAARYGWRDARPGQSTGPLGDKMSAVRPASDAPTAGDHPDTIVASRSAYHRSSCRLVAGTATEVITPQTAAERGLRACHVCQPRVRSA